MCGAKQASLPTAADYVAQNIEDDEVMLGLGLREPLLCAPRFSAGRIGAFAFVALVNFVRSARIIACHARAR